MGTKLEDYKGYRIKVGANGVFQAYLLEDGDGSVVASAMTLQALHERVNALSRQTFGQHVYVFDRYASNALQEGVITSIKENRPRYTNVTAYEYRKTWQYVYARYLVKNTAENLARITQLRDYGRQIAALDTKQRVLREALETYTDDELVGSKKDSKSEAVK